MSDYDPGTRVTVNDPELIGGSWPGTVSGDAYSHFGMRHYVVRLDPGATFRWVGDGRFARGWIVAAHRLEVLDD